jgi:hypothetical protein
MTDDPRAEILGEVQALRYEVEHLDSRAQARSLKRQLSDLLERAEALPPEAADAVEIVGALIDVAHSAVLQAFGTSAWDEPEGVDEVLARMVALSPAPATHLQLLSDAELVAAEELVRAAIRWTDTGPAAKVMPAFDLITGELRRLRKA